MSKRFVKKTAKGKTYYYLEENGTRSRISEQTYLSSKKLITFRYEKVNGKRVKTRVIKDDSLFQSLREEFGVAQVQYKINNLEKNKATITYKLIRSLLLTNKVDKLFSNLGYTPQEISDMYGIPVEELLDESRWKDNTFIDSKGNVYDVHFSYNDDVLVKIK